MAERYHHSPNGRTTHRRPDLIIVTDNALELDLEEPPLPAPERSLLWAVLERAMMDLSGRCLEGSQTWRYSGMYVADAAQWFTSEDESEWTFVWVCDHLQLDPERTRDTIYAAISRQMRAASEHAASAL